MRMLQLKKTIWVITLVIHFMNYAIKIPSIRRITVSALQSDICLAINFIYLNQCAWFVVGHPALFDVDEP